MYCNQGGVTWIHLSCKEVPHADTCSRCSLRCAGVFVPLLAQQTNTVYKYLIVAHFPPLFYKKKSK